jgi:hypothetical protein
MELKDYLLIFIPIVSSLVTSLITFFITRTKEKMIAKYEMEKLKMQHHHDLEKQQLKYDNQINIMQKEIEMSMGKDMVNQALGTILNTPAAKNNINKQVQQRFNKSKSRKR